MSDIQTVTDYRNNVFELSLVRRQMRWNYRHCLPVIFLVERASRLKSELIRFDVILDKIPDRAVRNAMCCRYALGMNRAEIALVMDISTHSVTRLLARGMRIIERCSGKANADDDHHDNVRG